MGLASMLDRILTLISKHPSQRSKTEIDVLLPWLRRRSKLLHSLDQDVLMTLCKNCLYSKVEKDSVLIRQGDVGNCFYVMLTGKASVFIDPLKSGEENAITKEAEKKERGEITEDTRESANSADTETQAETSEDTAEDQTGSLDRSRFGRFIMNYEPGQSFGEIALMTKESVRNASILLDEDADLLVIQRELFNDTIKARQEEDYAERNAFIRSCRLFDSWSPKFKRLLEMSLRKETFLFDSLLIQQGNPVEGLHFIIKGQAKQIVDCAMHKQQYSKMVDSTDSTLARELGRSFKKKKQVSGEKCSLNEQIRVRRREGYAAAEKRLAQKKSTVCFLDHSEVIGALEVVLGLETYCHSVRCTAATEVFVLDLKNIDRLIHKRNIWTLELLRRSVESKLRVRSKRRPDVELYPHLLKRVEELKPKQHNDHQRKVPAESEEVMSKKDEQFHQSLHLYKNDRGPLLPSSVPDSVYYMAKAMEKSRKPPPSSETAKKKNRGANPEVRLQRARKFATTRRQARSRRELEQLTIANEVEQFQLRDQDHVVNRYLSPTREVGGERDVHFDDGADSDQIFRLTELDGEAVDQMVLGPDHMKTSGVRSAVAELVGFESTSKANRARIICSMIERKQKPTPSALQKLLRPKSAPAGSRHHGDSDSDSDIEEFDYATGDAALNDLESKIRDFHHKYTKEGMRPRMQVASMKRFKVQNPDDVPVPGGTVFVKQRACEFPPGSYVNPSHHLHVRRYIVPRDAATMATQSMRAFEQQAIGAMQEEVRRESSSSSVSSADSQTVPHPPVPPKRALRAQSAPHRRLIKSPMRPQSRYSSKGTAQTVF